MENGEYLSVGENGFVAGGGVNVDGGQRREGDDAGLGMSGEKEQAVGTGPEVSKLVVVEEDVGGVGIEAAEPGAVDAAVDEQDGGGGLRGVEEQGGAGGELAVVEDDVAGAEVAVDGEGEVFGSEDGIEADEALVCGEQDGGHGGGDEQVGGERVAAAHKVRNGAEGEHAEGNGDEGSAEKAHGGASE